MLSRARPNEAKAKSSNGLNMLKAKIYQIEQDQRAELDRQPREKGILPGEIRSVRTSFSPIKWSKIIEQGETSNVQSVMDGEVLLSKENSGD
jgi:protein subunit release factor B